MATSIKGMTVREFREMMQKEHPDWNWGTGPAETSRSSQTKQERTEPKCKMTVAEFEDEYKRRFGRDVFDFGPGITVEPSAKEVEPRRTVTYTFIPDEKKFWEERKARAEARKESNNTNGKTN